VVEWYSRIASGKKVALSYGGRGAHFDNLSLPKEEMDYLRSVMNDVLSGTGANVGNGLSQNSIDPDAFIAKTGTAESASKLFNSSSSFIIANDKYTIGIMLSGRIPFNSQNLAAKNLFVSIIPILIKYRIVASST
jgi:cell division protein FtsI/penicillin-binding protein 2